MNPLIVLLAGLAISMAVIPVMWRLAPQLGMMDAPEQRKVHTVPVARIGGWGIVLGTLIPILLWSPIDKLLATYLFGSFVLLISGSIDDCRDIGHWGKFVGQFLAVLPVVIYGDLYVERLPFLGTDTLPAAVGIPFTVMAMVGMINAINHSDGLDGLAGGESLLSLIVVTLLAYLSDGADVVIIAVATIGGVLGFLRYNTHPARVFMGDSGSQFLGFTLAFLAVLLTQRTNPALSQALPALLLGLPIMDILAVFWLRASSGMNWFRATRNHIHHRLLDLGFEHYETVVGIYSVQAFFVIGAILLRYQSDAIILVTYLGTCTAIFVALTVAERRGWKVRRDGTESRLTNILSSSMGRRIFVNAPLVFLSIGLPAYIAIASVLTESVPRDFGIISAVLFAVMLIELIFGKAVRSVVVRGAVYATATFVVYLQMHYPAVSGSPLSIIEITFFCLVALALALSIRFDRDAQFKTTTMDYLVVFVVVTMGIFFASDEQGQVITTLIIKSMVLLYACEVLIDRLGKRWSALNVAALFALGLLGVRGLW